MINNTIHTTTDAEPVLNDWLSEVIDDASAEYDDCKLRSAFVAGAKFALANQWVNADDVLPEDDRDILIEHSRGIAVGYFDDPNWYVYGVENPKNIKRWMQIPHIPGYEHL